MEKRYDLYLLTSTWREKADKRLGIDKYKCQMCGCEGTPQNPLQVHHLTYHNIYNENIDKDLVTLCKVCHTHVHNMMNRVTNSETGQRGWKDTLPYSVHVTSVNEMECDAIFRKDGEDEEH